MRRLWLALLLALLPSVAWADEGGGDRVAIGGDVVVVAGESVPGSLIVIGGNAEVRGDVGGDVVVIGGSLRDPTVAPSVAPIAARVGVAAGLAAVSPALAILPFIDLGNTPDVDCRRVLGAPDNASVPVKEDSAAAGETDASSRAAPARGS